MTSVMIVDDHPIWRTAVEADLTAAGFEVLAAVGDAETALRIISALQPDVVLLDLHLPGQTGVTAAARITADNPSSRILIFSATGEDADVLAAVKAGASGYLMKSAARAELIAAVTHTAAGEAVFSAGLAALVLGEYNRMATQERDKPELTERETVILRLVATGLTAKSIAERLTISPRTAQNHIQNTLRKLQLHNRVELTRWAIEKGLHQEP